MPVLYTQYDRRKFYLSINIECSGDKSHLCSQMVAVCSINLGQTYKLAIRKHCRTETSALEMPVEYTQYGIQFEMGLCTKIFQ